MRLTLLALLAAGAAGCGGTHVASGLSEPIRTDDGSVWWLDYRAAERGSNDVHVTVCRPGERPLCVRFRPEPGSAR